MKWGEWGQGWGASRAARMAATLPPEEQPRRAVGVVLQRPEGTSVLVTRRGYVLLWAVGVEQERAEQKGGG